MKKYNAIVLCVVLCLIFLILTFNFYFLKQTTMSNLKNSKLFRKLRLPNSTIAKTSPLWQINTGIIDNDKILYQNFTYIFFHTTVNFSSNIHRCQNQDIAVGVLSASKNLIRRQSIRKTWGKNKCVYFIISSFFNLSLHMESVQYEDIIFVHKQEKYSGVQSSLPLQTATWFYIVYNKMPEVQFAIKTDDDSYVKIDNARKQLIDTGADYWGHKRRGTPIRDPTSRYFLSFDVFRRNEFPNFCSGAGYALSRKALQCFVNRVSTVDFVGLEDVATGLVMEKCAIPTMSSMQVHPFTKVKNWVIAHYVDIFQTHLDVLQQFESEAKKKSKLIAISEQLQKNDTRKYQCLEFVHITKTGGTAIEAAAAEKNIIWGACHHIPHIKTCQGINTSSTSKINNYLWHDYRQKYKCQNLFTIVRNPYTRIVSEFYCPWNGYRGINQTRRIFNKWIQRSISTARQNPINSNGHLTPASRYVFDKFNFRQIGHVLKYENLTFDFHNLMQQYNLPIQLAEYKINSSKKRKLFSILDFDNVSLKAINEFYLEDFKNFGYKMNVSL